MIIGQDGHNAGNTSVLGVFLVDPTGAGVLRLGLRLGALLLSFVSYN